MTVSRPSRLAWPALFGPRTVRRECINTADIEALRDCIDTATGVDGLGMVVVGPLDPFGEPTWGVGPLGFLGWPELEALKEIARIRDIPGGRTQTFTNEAVADKYQVRDADILVGMDGIFHPAFAR
jgi:hypothetical protein